MIHVTHVKYDRLRLTVCTTVQCTLYVHFELKIEAEVYIVRMYNK